MGFDPSMSNWGIVEGFYYPSTSQITIENGYVIQPAKHLEKAKSVRKNSTDLQQANFLASRIQLALDVWKPQALFVEMPIGSQNARAMCSYGMCLGLLGWVKQTGKSFFMVTPTEVKLAMNQAKTASKQDMINAAVASHPNMQWPTLRGEIIKSQAEHIADAIGAVHAGICLQEFSNLISIAKGA